MLCHVSGGHGNLIGRHLARYTWHNVGVPTRFSTILLKVNEYIDTVRWSASRS